MFRRTKDDTIIDDPRTMRITKKMQRYLQRQRKHFIAHNVYTYMPCKSIIYIIVYGYKITNYTIRKHHWRSVVNMS